MNIWRQDEVGSKGKGKRHNGIPGKKRKYNRMVRSNGGCEFPDGN